MMSSCISSGSSSAPSSLCVYVCVNTDLQVWYVCRVLKVNRERFFCFFFSSKTYGSLGIQEVAQSTQTVTFRYDFLMLFHASRTLNKEQQCMYKHWSTTRAKKKKRTKGEWSNMKNSKYLTRHRNSWKKRIIALNVLHLRDMFGVGLFSFAKGI